MISQWEKDEKGALTKCIVEQRRNKKTLLLLSASVHDFVIHGLRDHTTYPHYLLPKNPQLSAYQGATVQVECHKGKYHLQANLHSCSTIKKCLLMTDILHLLACQVATVQAECNKGKQYWDGEVYWRLT